MKKLKLLSLAGLMIVSSLVSALAATHKVTPPRNHKGDEINPLYGGYLHMRLSSTDEMVVCSGRCLLAAVSTNTGPITSRVQIRNTSVANGTGALVIERYFPQAMSNPGAKDLIPLPILLDKGISVDLTAASAAEEVTVLYLDLDE